MDNITITMPNKHYFTVNLAKFPKVGSKTNNEVFLPVDKPSGLITATVGRKQLMSKL
jgi:urate oxidase